MFDLTNVLFDRRTEPPEEWDICPDCKNEWEPHETWCPTHPSEGYLALQEWHAGPEGTPCPACEGPRPDCTYWCHEGNAEGEPSYRITPADFLAGGRYDDKDY